MIRISIIIPVYKVEQYIQRCLQSVMEQQWDNSMAEVECILVDDCTPDNSMAIAKEMIEKYEGPIIFKCIRHDVNRGLSAARNTGTSEATGDYILYIDSDDHIAPNSIHIYNEYLKKHPDIDLIWGQVIRIPANTYLSNPVEQAQLLKSQPNVFRQFVRIDFQISAWNKLIRLSLLKQNRIDFIEGIIFEDCPWNYKLFLHTESALLIPETTYYYTDNPSGIMALAYKDDKINKAINSYLTILDYLLSNQPVNKEIIIEYLLYIHLIMARLMHLLLIRSDSKQQRDFIKLRNRLLLTSVKNRRILITCFCLLFVKPFHKTINIDFFRKKYYYLQKTIREFSHLTDFLH